MDAILGKLRPLIHVASIRNSNASFTWNSDLNIHSSHLLKSSTLSSEFKEKT